MREEIIKKHTCTCHLCGARFRAATERRLCASCRRLEWRRNLKMSENIRRSKIYGKKTY